MRVGAMQIVKMFRGEENNQVIIALACAINKKCDIYATRR